MSSQLQFSPAGSTEQHGPTIGPAHGAHGNAACGHDATTLPLPPASSMVAEGQHPPQPLGTVAQQQQLQAGSDVQGMHAGMAAHAGTQQMPGMLPAATMPESIGDAGLKR